MFGTDDFGKDGESRQDQDEDGREAGASSSRDAGSGQADGDQAGFGATKQNGGAGGPKGKGIMDGILPDIVKRLFVAGIGAVAVSEEGLRRLATEFSLPKDVAVFMMSQVQTTKSELFRIIATEIRDFLEHVNLAGELQRVLTSLTFEIKMQVRLRPSEDDGVRPQVKGGVKVFKNGKHLEQTEDDGEQGGGKRPRRKGSKQARSSDGPGPSNGGEVAK